MTEEMYCVEGISLKPLWADPKQTWKAAAFSQYPRPYRLHAMVARQRSSTPVCRSLHDMLIVRSRYSGFGTTADGLPPFVKEKNSTHKQEQVMGHTIRVDQWRCKPHPPPSSLLVHLAWLG